MKNILFVLLFSCFHAIAQRNTEIYLFDINKTDAGYLLSNKRNISKNPGYDNQPYFYDNHTILFSSSRNGQTDIGKYNIQDSTKVFLNDTPNGGEYSPQRIPQSNNISAVRLDDTGLQRFYSYDLKTGQPKELISNLKIAYPVWGNKNIVVSAVIGKNSLELVISDLLEKSNLFLEQNIGRSMHKIPNSERISYIKKGENFWEIRSLDITKLKTEKITNIPGKYEDICWMPDGSILLAKKNQVFRYHPKNKKDWKPFITFKDFEMQKVSRIAVSPDGTKLAIVGEESP